MLLLLIAFLVLVPVADAAAQTAPPAAPAPAGQPSASAQVKPPSDYLVGPQDVLNIIVYGEPAPLTGRFRVDNDGTFPYQYLDRVKAEGLTVGAIEDALEKALGDGYLRNPQISVEVGGLPQPERVRAGPGSFARQVPASGEREPDGRDVSRRLDDCRRQETGWRFITRRVRAGPATRPVGTKGARHPRAPHRCAERQGAGGDASRTATRSSCRRPSAFTSPERSALPAPTPTTTT